MQRSFAIEAFSSLGYVATIGPLTTLKHTCSDPRMPAIANTSATQSSICVRSATFKRMNEFQNRRQQFVSRMGQAVAIFPSAPEVVRTNDCDYSYRQNTDLYYLTGFEEPESILVLAPAHTEARSALFVRTHDKEKETWNGRRAGVEGAKTLTGVDETYPISEFYERLDGFLETADRLFYSFGTDRELDERIA